MSVDERMRTGLRQAYVSLDSDVEAALVHVESGARHQRVRRTLVLATAAAVIAVAGVVWGPWSLGSLTGQDDVQPVDEPNVLDGDWRLVEDSAFDGVHGLSGVAEVDGRLVAVGEGETPVLTSTDGVDWTAADVPAALIRDVIVGGPGVIASGQTTDGDAALWTSPDGLTWTQVDDPAELLGDPAFKISVLTVGGLAFRESSDSQPETQTWISADGLTWIPIHHPYGGAVADVTAGGPGFVVVGGVTLAGETWGSPPAPAPEGGPEAAAVWTSSDGESWSRVPHEPGVFSPAPYVEMGTVTAGGQGLLAFGNGSDGHATWPVMWTSVDGLTWTLIPDEDLGIDGFVKQVIDTAGELIAVGSSRGAPDAAVWTSGDGVTWDRVADESFGGPKGQIILDVIETATGLVAVGVTDWDQENTNDNHRGAVWVMERP